MPKATNMTTLHQLNDNCLAVAGLPSDAVAMFTGFIGDELEYIRMDIPLHSIIKIPEGNWRILGKANELTEEQWKEVVPEIHKGAYVNCDKKTRSWKDYNWDFYTDTATESGASLLKFHELENPLILIKE